MPTSTLQIPSTWSSSHVPEARIRQRNWTNTPFYRTVPRDQRPVNSYSDSRKVLKQDYNVGGAYYVSPGGIKTYDLLPGYIWSPADLEQAYFDAYLKSNWSASLTQLQDKVVLDLLGKIADQKANLAVAYAEAHKTSEHILHTVHRVNDALFALRHGRFKQVAEELGITSKKRHKTWLEYKYGWMPLLMDIKGTAELFAQHVLGRPLRFSVQKNVDVQINWSSRTYYPAYGGGTSYWDESLTGLYHLRVKLWAEVVNPHMSALQQMGLTNPALVAWELVPYSFVIDWVLSVGDWLKALSALHGVTLKRALRSNINDLSYHYHQPATSYQGSNGYFYFNDARTKDIHERAYSRGIPTTDVLNISIPRGWDNLGFTKLVTSLALFKDIGIGRVTSKKLPWLL